MRNRGWLVVLVSTSLTLSITSTCVAAANVLVHRTMRNMAVAWRKHRAEVADPDRVRADRERPRETWRVEVRGVEPSSAVVAGDAAALVGLGR